MHFIDVLHASHVDDDLVAIFDLFQRCEGSRQPVCVGDVGGEHRVAIPSGEGGAVEPAGVIAEPTYIPGLVGVLGLGGR